MLLQYLVLCGIGVVLGLEHALEADHIVAVVNLTSRTKSMRRAALLGSVWGMGHSVTLIVSGLIILVTRLAIPDWLAMLLEMLAAVLLIVLGIDTVWKAIHVQVRAAEHSADQPTSRSFLVGIVNGLAGSAALVLLVLSTFEFSEKD